MCQKLVPLWLMKWEIFFAGKGKQNVFGKRWVAITGYINDEPAPSDNIFAKHAHSAETSTHDLAHFLL